ncbi:SulP family inorganic anion transporter [Tatumella sp. TA1]|uniref:SulP family inorganic anion transporter n=1 Tax=Rosenbergiella collisarenosi TaxID=1544695 RepID=UPI0008F8C618|nr:SulP family inorganic anion transporter [Rosenbergiella collisarenosi]MBT0721167.1 SulP family inorganic anion transporter [Rosenbergiella collisarenosi]QGX91156.1 SulP family inorganic anion transporter [Tatumella sp. TA1]
MEQRSAAKAGHVKTVLSSPSLLITESLAGIVTALALIPEVISFSVISGVDPKVSLIASFVICLTLSFIGGRPAMVSAAAGSVALVIGPMVAAHGVNYILPTVVLAGALQILFGVLGLARMMRYIPQAVMTGFVNALGILIFMAQVPHILGHGPLVWVFFAVTLAIVIGLPRVFTAIPAPLIAIVLLTSIAIYSGIHLPNVGDEGTMSPGLPGFNALHVPLNWQTLSIIWPAAISVALVGLMESLLTAKLVDDITDTPSNKHRESWGLGVANLFAAFYGGVPGCAMIGQTIVNVELGKARSRVSTVIAAIVLLLLVSVLSQVMAKIPMVVLAAIMVIVSAKTLNWHSLQPKTLRRLPVSETLIMLFTVVVTVWTSNLALGVVVGAVFATLLFARRISHIIVARRSLSADGQQVTYHVEGPLFFASSNDLYEHFDYANDPQQVIIDLSAAQIWDASSVSVLDSIEHRYQRHHCTVTLVGLAGRSEAIHQRVSAQHQ